MREQVVVMSFTLHSRNIWTNRAEGRMPLVRVIWLFPFEAFNAIFALMLSLVASNLA